MNETPVRYLFKGFTPPENERGAYEKFGRIVNSVLHKVGVHADTHLLNTNNHRPMSVAEMSDYGKAHIEQFLGEEGGQLSPLPRVAFRTARDVALGAVAESEQEAVKSLEGLILHEAWHVLSPRDRIAQTMYNYHEIHNIFSACANLVRHAGPQTSRALISKQFGSTDSFKEALAAIQRDIIPTSDKILQKAAELRSVSPAKLADQFAKKPFELLPGEEIFKELLKPTELDAYILPFHNLCVALAREKRAHDAVGGTFLSPLDVELESVASKFASWEAISKTYSRALEFSCDEFAKANSQNPDSLPEALSGFLRYHISEAARVGAVMLSGDEIDRLHAALKTGRVLENPTPAEKTVYQKVVYSEGMAFKHPSFAQRLKRLQDKNPGTSPYRTV